MTQLDPREFIITRKRKKYKFALFHNSPLCYETEEWQQATPVDVLELAAGTGLFAVALAEAAPEQQVLAVDVKADRLQAGARVAAERGLANIRFLRARIEDQLAHLLRPHSVQDIWVTFADPFPKKRAAKNRLTHPKFLALYEQLLVPDGALYIKHDNRDFFCWTLERLVAAGWRIDELSFDLHESQLPDRYKVMTTYERRWVAEGASIHFVKVSKPTVSS